MRKRDLCDTFRSLSHFVWTKLRQCYENSIRWEETTITDHILLTLRRKHPEEILIHKFTRQQESQTGADMEFWLTGSSRKWFGLRIQAKVIEPSSLKYPYLYSRNNRQQYQYDTLIQSSLNSNPKVVPLYCLYTFHPCLDAWPRRRYYHRRVCPDGCRCCIDCLGNYRCCIYYLELQILAQLCPLDCLCHKGRPRPSSFGCSWIPATLVKELAQQGQPTALRDLFRYMSPWCRTVCGPTGDLPQRAFRWWQSVGNTERGDAGVELVEEPPLYVQQLIGGGIPRMPEERPMSALVIIKESSDEEATRNDRKGTRQQW